VERWARERGKTMDVFTISTPGETDGGMEYPLPTVIRTPADLLDLIRSSVDTKAELNEMGVVMFLTLIHI